MHALALLQLFQQTGVLICAEKKLEIELLLKNSIFSSTMLLNLINDLLDLAKMENSSFILNTSYFNLFDVIQTSIDTLDFQVTQKCIKVTHSYNEADLGYFQLILGDENRYQQILLNFLSNALKFTPEYGNITISTLLKDS